MALDQSFIGRSYPPRPVYEVSREKIAEFVTAIGDASALSRDPEAARAAGYPDVIAPPTFLMIIVLTAIDVLAADPDLGLDYSRMVHGDQSFTYSRAVHAGDRLAVTTHVEEILARAGNDFLTVRADIHDDSGALVCTGKAQLVVRGEAA